MSGAEVTSLAASSVSMGLAIFAIGLSLVFFRWSSQSSDRTNTAADRIEQSVEQLRGELFSTLRETLDNAERRFARSRKRQGDREKGGRASRGGEGTDSVAGD